MNENILVVEDEAAVRDLISLVLRENGYNVWEAATAEQAERIGGARRIDVVISNVVLPGRSGTDLAISLLDSQPHIRFVFVSGWIELRRHDTTNIARMPEGTYTTLEKPFAPDVLTAHVRKFLGEQRTRTA